MIDLIFLFSNSVFIVIASYFWGEYLKNKDATVAIMATLAWATLLVKVALIN